MSHQVAVPFLRVLSHQAPPAPHPPEQIQVHLTPKSSWFDERGRRRTIAKCGSVNRSPGDQLARWTRVTVHTRVLLASGSDEELYRNTEVDCCVNGVPYAQYSIL